MKSFLKWIVSSLEETPGILSSKRILSAICVTTAIVLAVMGKPVDQVIAFLSSAAVFQGITAFQK